MTPSTHAPLPRHARVERRTYHRRSVSCSTASGRRKSNTGCDVPGRGCRGAPGSLLKNLSRLVYAQDTVPPGMFRGRGEVIEIFPPPRRIVASVYHCLGLR